MLELSIGSSAQQCGDQTSGRCTSNDTREEIGVQECLDYTKADGQSGFLGAK